MPELLVVEARDADDAPVSGVEVSFDVIGSDGFIGPLPGTRHLTQLTDETGRASISFTLGRRAGLATHVVEATADGFEPTQFAHDAEPGEAAKIFVETGDQQRDVAGQQLTFPLAAAVTDAGLNRVANVPVTFQVVRGSGQFENGESILSTGTDSSGRAVVPFVLGEDDGIANNVVEATIDALGDEPFAAFVATGLAAGRAAETRVQGVVRDPADDGIADVRVSILGTAATTFTDEDGYFNLENVQSGLVHLLVEGETTSRPGTWPSLEYTLVNVPGRTNEIGRPIDLLPLDLAQGRSVTATGGGRLTLAGVPGFALDIAPGSVTFPDGGNEGVVSVTVVNNDNVPMSPAFAQQPRFIITVQPAGALFDPPARLSLPNTDGLPPGTTTDLYSFDHDLGAFVSIGPGTVSEDGLSVVSNPGVGILKAGWHCGGDPNETGTPHNCPSCRVCDGSQCVPGCPFPTNSDTGESPLFEESPWAATTDATSAGCPCPQDDPCARKGCQNGSCVVLERREIKSIRGFANGEEFLQIFEPRGRTRVEFVAEIEQENCTDLSVKFTSGGNPSVTQNGTPCSGPDPEKEYFCWEWVYEEKGLIDASVEATCGSCDRELDDIPIDILEIAIQIEQIGDTEVSTDGEYTEDTRIRLTSVVADTGEPYPFFSGSVEVVDERGIYDQNRDEGASFPDVVPLQDGVAEFVAKSLADPLDAQNKPRNSVIDVRGEFELYRGEKLEIEHWIDKEQIHDLSVGPAFDWLEIMVKDHYEQATGTHSKVLAPVRSWKAVYVPDAGGQQLSLGDGLSEIDINPYFTTTRTNGSTTSICSQPRNKNAFNTVAHEARHAYQYSLRFVDLDAPDDDGNPSTWSNDDDRDEMLDIVPIAPNSVILDTEDERTVCGANANGELEEQSQAFSGDDTFDSLPAAREAWEMDAYIYGGQNDG